MVGPKISAMKARNEDSMEHAKGINITSEWWQKIKSLAERKFAFVAKSFMEWCHGLLQDELRNVKALLAFIA